MYRLIRSETDTANACEILASFLEKGGWDTGEMRLFIEEELLNREEVSTEDAEWLGKVLERLHLTEELSGLGGEEDRFFELITREDNGIEEIVLILCLLGPKLRPEHQKARSLLRALLQCDTPEISTRARYILSRLRDQEFRKRSEETSGTGPSIDRQVLAQELANRFPQAPVELDEWLCWSVELRLASIMNAHQNPEMEAFFTASADLVWQLENHPFMVSNLAKNLPAILARQKRLNSRFLTHWRKALTHREARMRANALEGLLHVLQSPAFEEEYWPYLENALSDPHHRVRSTGLSVAYQIRPLDTLERIEGELTMLNGQEDFKAMRWLLSSTQGFDQNYQEELDRIETQMHKLEPAPWPRRIS